MADVNFFFKGKYTQKMLFLDVFILIYIYLSLFYRIDLYLLVGGTLRISDNVFGQFRESRKYKSPAGFIPAGDACLCCYRLR